MLFFADKVITSNTNLIVFQCLTLETIHAKDSMTKALMKVKLSVFLVINPIYNQMLLYTIK